MYGNLRNWKINPLPSLNPILNESKSRGILGNVVSLPNFQKFKSNFWGMSYFDNIAIFETY